MNCLDKNCSVLSIACDLLYIWRSIALVNITASRIYSEVKLKTLPRRLMRRDSGTSHDLNHLIYVNSTEYKQLYLAILYVGQLQGPRWVVLAGSKRLLHHFCTL